MSTRRIIGILGLVVVLSFIVFGCSDSPTGPSKDYSGSWKGKTSTGGSVSFKVAGGKVSELSIEHRTGSCSGTLKSTKDVSISGNSFKFEHKTFLEEGKIGGTFTSETTCSGKYYFKGLSLTPGCPSEINGTFDANRQ